MTYIAHGVKMFTKITPKIHRRWLMAFIFILLAAFLIQLAYAAVSPWTQTNWSGGSGQTNWSDATKYDSSSNIDVSSGNQISLINNEKLSNPTFDSDLTSWSEIPSYSLNDQFTTYR